MDEDEDMQGQGEEQGLKLPGQEVIKFGEAKLASKDARAAAIAQGNIEMHNAETLELPEVRIIFCSRLHALQSVNLLG